MRVRFLPTYNDIEKVSPLGKLLEQILAESPSSNTLRKIKRNLADKQTYNITSSYLSIASPQLFGNSSWRLKMRQ